MLPIKPPPYSADEHRRWSEERKAWAERVGYGRARSCGNCAYVDRPEGEFGWYCYREEPAQMVSSITDACRSWTKAGWVDYPIAEPGAADTGASHES